MPSKLVIALALSPAAALQLPGVGEVALKLPSAPALPSTKDLKVAAIDFVAEARQNPLSALPAAAGVAGLALFAAASSLSPTVVPEGGEYRGLGIGQDGIVRVGFPAGGEVLVPGAPFQPENGYLGMWNWEKQVKPVPKDQTPEAQKALRAAFDAERKKFDVEAQQQGFKSAEARGIAEKEKILAEKAAAKAAKEAAKAAKAATPAKPVYYGNIKGIAQPSTYGVGAPKK